MVLHLFARHHASEQHQCANEVADAVFRCWTPGDAGVRRASLVQSNEIGVEGQHHSPVSTGEGELVRVRNSAAAGLLARHDINAAMTQTLDDRSREVLISEKSHRVRCLVSGAWSPQVPSLPRSLEVPAVAS